MLCSCGSDSGVIESRPTSDNSIRRRRECVGCRARWTTMERKSSLAESGPSHRSGEVPARSGHALLRFFFEEKVRRHIAYSEISKKSGVPIKTMKNWKRRNPPTLINLVSVLEAIGWEVVAVRRK